MLMLKAFVYLNSWSVNKLEWVQQHLQPQRSERASIQVDSNPPSTSADSTSSRSAPSTASLLLPIRLHTDSLPTFPSSSWVHDLYNMSSSIASLARNALRDPNEYRFRPSYVQTFNEWRQRLKRVVLTHVQKYPTVLSVGAGSADYSDYQNTHPVAVTAPVSSTLSPLYISPSPLQLPAPSSSSSSRALIDDKIAQPHSTHDYLQHGDAQSQDNDRSCLLVKREAETEKQDCADDEGNETTDNDTDKRYVDQDEEQNTQGGKRAEQEEVCKQSHLIGVRSKRNNAHKDVTEDHERKDDGEDNDQEIESKETRCVSADTNSNGINTSEQENTEVDANANDRVYDKSVKKEKKRKREVDHKRNEGQRVLKKQKKRKTKKNSEPVEGRVYNDLQMLIVSGHVKHCGGDVYKCNACSNRCNLDCSFQRCKTDTHCLTLRHIQSINDLLD